VKVDPLPLECVTVVTGRWTGPDGATRESNSIASGTRRRAEFPFWSETPSGTFEFVVVAITCGTEYSYHGNDSASITISPTPTPAPADPVPAEPSPTDPPTTEPPIPSMSIISISMSHKGKRIWATFTVVDANGDPVEGAVVTAYWVSPASTIVEEDVDATSNRKGEVAFIFQEKGSGTYTFTAYNLASPTGEEYAVVTWGSITI